jgi:hypothetical protein
MYEVQDNNLEYKGQQIASKGTEYILTENVDYLRFEENDKIKLTRIQEYEHVINIILESGQKSQSVYDYEFHSIMDESLVEINR